MSEIEELREEVRKLREEIAALRLSGTHVTHTHYHGPAPMAQPYYVPPYQPYSPIFPPFPITCLAGAAQSHGLGGTTQ
jgi:hypothetical protein